MCIQTLVSFAIICLISVTSAGAVGEASSSIPLFNIKPPLPIFNGSTYSKLAPTGTRPRLLTTGTTTGFPTSASNEATYNGHVFPTLCPGSDTACLTTCKSFAGSCSADFSSWSSRQRVHQSSMADRVHGGSMPFTTSHHIQTEKGTTIWSYETSWLEYKLTTQVEGWGAGSLGLTTTLLTDADGRISTSTGYKSGMLDIVYTSSVPIAVGGTGTPISTSEAHYNTFTFTQTSWYDYTVPKPTCSPSSWTDCRYSSDCNKCTISGGTVQLLYFPVPSTEGAATASATTTSPPASTALETAVYKNVTLTSPSVYISFQTAYAQNDCGTQVGKRYPGAILPLPLSDLSSVYGGYGTLYSSDPLAPLGAFSNTPYLAAGQFNLADLNWPPPMSAYTNQLKFALGRELFSIMTKPYNPHLAVPSQVRELDPAWASCGLDWEGLYDPPSALQPAEVEAKPTMSAGEEVYQSAMPQSSASRVPAKTSTSKESAFFTAPASLEASSRQTASSATLPIISASSTPHSSTGQVQTGPAENLQASIGVEDSSAAADGLATDPQEVSKMPSQSTPSSFSLSSNEPQQPVGTTAATKTILDPVVSATSSTSAVVNAVSAGITDVPDDPSIIASTAISTSRPDEENTGLVHQAAEKGQTSDTTSAQDTSATVTTVSAPLVVAIGSQTVTEGGSAQTISNEIISLAATEIVVGSSEIGIPRIEAGTQHISLPVGSSTQLMGMTFIAGQTPVQTQPSTMHAKPQVTVDPGTLDSTIPRAIFSFGTRTYTAIQTGGTAEAVIGTTTLTAGEALSLKGGTVSLVSGHLELDPDPSRTSKASGGLETAEGAVVTLAQTTVSIVRLANGDVLYGSKTLSAADSVITAGSQTLSFNDNGIVVAGKSHTATVEFEPTTRARKSNVLESKSTLSSNPVPSHTAGVTTSSRNELPGVTTASTTTSSGADRLCAVQGSGVVLAFLVSTMLWCWPLQ